MNKDKLSYLGIVLFIVFIVINLLVFFNIIPFSIWKTSNTIMAIASLVISILRKNIKEKDKKMTLIGFGLVFIIVITECIVLFKFI